MATNLNITACNDNNNNSEEPIIRNFCYDNDSGNLMIHDSNNNHYKVDIFGRKKINFLPEISGSVNRYEKKNNQSPIKTNKYNTPNNIITKRNSKIDINYFPSIRKFEGYSKFPYPKGSPFCNMPNYDIKEEAKKELINQLNECYSLEKCLNNINHSNENNGLSYLTCDLNEFSSLKNDTENLLKLIENTFEDLKEKYKMKSNMIYKDPIYKTLKKFKKYLLLNKDSNLVNGRQLKQPNINIKKNYRIINSIINRSGLSSNNSSRFAGISTSNNSASNIRKKKIKFIGPDKLNDLCRSKDLTIGRIIKMNFGCFSPENKGSETTKNSVVENENDKNVEFIKIELPKISKKNLDKLTKKRNKNKKGDEDKETEETVNDNDEIEKSKSELSFISIMSENEKKYQKKNIINVKSVRNINLASEHDNKLLVGYQEKEQNDDIVKRPVKFQFKNNGELYKSDINLLKLSNPIAFKLQEQRDKNDLKFLTKKLKLLSLNTNNMMKGKMFKIKKDEEDN